ncbi:MAG: family transcriptional regulator [Rhodoglobus sp.]|nr:family transcriptional regulator [Rhodoglobus sp.]
MVPQEEVLVRVLRVLGLDVDEQRFNPQTELWLSMMGTLIEAIPDERRAPAVDGALRVLGDGLKASNVVPANDTDVLAELPVLSREESKKVNLALAAQERQRKRDAKLNDDHA